MIGIIILNYNNWDETLKCINSILKTTLKVDYRIYLVDNASSIEMPECFYNILDNKTITFLKSEKNQGYSAGNNIGIKKALEDNCEKILISNNDVYYNENSILELSRFLDLNRDVGIVGPKIYLMDGSIQEINMGVKMGIREKYKYLIRKTPLKFLIKDFLMKFNAINNDLEEPFNVYAVSGCCFMMTKECAMDITPLDENCFLYEEENIIGCKMEKSGYLTVYNPNSNIIHAHGQATKGMGAFSYTCFVESELYYCKFYLNVPNLKVFPLYIIRTCKYIKTCIYDKSYRANFRIYISKTFNMLNKNQRR